MTRPEAADSGRTALSGRKAQAIRALISGATQSQVAKAAKVSERTVRRWLHEDDDFRASYSEAQRRVMEHTVAELQTSCSRAVAALTQILSDKSAAPSARVSAARTILAFAFERLDRDLLIDRVDRIESTLRTSGAAEG